MAIIKPAARKLKIASAPQFDEIAPFVPARDLYEAAQLTPTKEELVAIATALYLSTPPVDLARPWASQARISALRS
ncbi:MAG: hypothetical protein K1X79_09840 [Oligoflexia bacterium]|nr:hypothetical protein [Oligoflexia bacterium]